MEQLKGFGAVSVMELAEPNFSLIGREWMLLTCTDKAGGRHNAMTASWGGLGFIWGAPAAFFFIRPQRFTRVLADASDDFTISFFGDKYRRELGEIYGRLSGADTDKDALAGFTPALLPSGAVAYENARLILECRKRYAQELRGDCFVSADEDKANYPGKDYHKMYIAEVTGAFIKDAGNA